MWMLNKKAERLTSAWQNGKFSGITISQDK